MADAGEAAGNAAKDRALASSWPPSQGDYEAIGAAAGIGACAALGAGAASPLCGLVGSAVGSGAYQLGSAIGNGLDPGGHRPTCWENELAYYDAAVAYVARTVESVGAECRTDSGQTIRDLIRWGAPISGGGAPKGAWACYKWRDKWYALTTPARWERNVFAAAAARIAECQTRRVTIAPGLLRYGMAIEPAKPTVLEALLRGLRWLWP